MFLAKLIRLMTVIAFVSPFAAFANDSSDHHEHDAIIEANVANETTCVKGYQENKIYLNSKNLHPTDHGLFLDLNGEDYALLPTLQADGDGCFIPLMYHSGDRSRMCPSCGNETDKAGNCQDSECKRNPKNRVKDRQERQKDKKKKK